MNYSGNKTSDSAANSRDTAEQRQKNRSEMPNVAAMLDRIREANPGLAYKVIGVEDKVAGKKVGTL